MLTSTSMRWLVVAVSAAMLLAVAAACSSETIEVPGETVVVEKVVTETVEVPGETVVVEKEVIRTVEVPGETVTKEVVKEVMVRGETVVVKEEVVKTVEVPGQTVVKEVVKTVEVPGQTVVVEKEVVKTVEVPGPERVVVKEVPSGKNYVTDPVFGTVVSAPEYGGTLTVARCCDPNLRVDPHPGGPSLSITSGVLEKLALVDWTIDRDTYPFVGGYNAPAYALTGALAESWEISADGLTYTFPIRQGVHWHDKPPVNGRELTAYDVEHSYHRMLGNKLTGTEFSEAEPSPGGGSLVALPFESVEATDKWTVVMKLKEPILAGLDYILDWYNMAIQPPEVVEQYGDDWDWQNMVGTGPYMITDLVPGSSITYNKNPEYWGFDEKYPENRLPYIDEYRQLAMPDNATKLAALRSAKIDFAGPPGGGQLSSVDQAESLMRTNPELVVHTWSERSNANAWLDVSKPPFDDIRVRYAMQMALDLETMNFTYFKGNADTIPRGRVGRAYKGYNVPFEEWPEEIKQYHRYDPERADKLLDEAGYPRGADGIRFKTTYLHLQRFDLGWAELSAAYWRDIGVDVDIELAPDPEYVARQIAGDFGISVFVGGVKAFPVGQMNNFWSGWDRNAVVRDAEYDAWYEAMQAAATIEEQQRLVKQMDMRSIEQFWVLWGPMSPNFTVHQPWVIGYNNEGGFGGRQLAVLFSRLWIDSELKEEMGH